MRRLGCVTLLALLPAVSHAQQPASSAAPFTLAQVLGYPYPQEMVAAPHGAAAAWVLDERGARNVWAAAGPDWTPRRLTAATTDDGQELTQLGFTPDGKTVIYVRGGNHGSNWPAAGNLPPDPTSSPIKPKVEIWAAPVAGGGAPRALAEGDAPAVSPRGDRVAFIRDDQVWTVPLDSGKPAAQLFFTRGSNGSLEWSPDGSRLAFVSDRGDHSFIGIFTDDSTPIRYLAPTTARDFNPVWSPDGKQVAFIRTPGAGGPPDPYLELTPNPWAIWVGDVATGSAAEVWRSPNTLRGSYPETAGETNLSWGPGGARLVFLADLDGWPHLYSVAVSGGPPVLLTPGNFMVEFVAAAPNHQFIVYAGNGGPDSNDIDRRHLFRVAVDRPGATALTSGTGLEYVPVVTGDSRTIVFLSTEPQRPPVPAVLPVDGGKFRLIGADRLPADYPTAQLVTPRKVVFQAPDGTPIHGQLFEQTGKGAPAGKRPGVIFVHGGPPRQMLLGWHYWSYYANDYAVGQWLASRGYVVLSVNYRLGIGYGHEFHHPPHAGPAGAAEYQDVLAGGRFLAGLSEVDPKRVGIWGGSYGGYLTALALARNSDVFAAGVDIHGVHDWLSDIRDPYDRPLWHFERGDVDSARIVAWHASPVADIATWKSPVLLIQGDDDRNVHFAQMVDLVRRLDKAGVHYEELVIPDEIHAFLRYQSRLTVDSATVAFFARTLGAH